MKNLKALLVVAMAVAAAFFLTACFPTGPLIDVDKLAEADAYETADALHPDNTNIIIDSMIEPVGDNKLDIPETDIVKVGACYDDSRLRFDIMLGSSVKMKQDTFFGVVFYYSSDNFEDYYVYYPLTDEYEKYVFDGNDKLQGSMNLFKDTKSADTAGLTSVGGGKDNVVTIVIDKAKHLNGTPGKLYFLAMKFVSGLYKDSGVQYSDSTPYVKVYFKF